MEQEQGRCPNNPLDNICLENSFDIDKIMHKHPDLNRDAIQERAAEILQYRNTLKSLLDVPIVEQKTEAWYAMRQDLVTASDFAQALGEGKFGSVKQFLQKKCEPLTDADQTASKVNPFFRWGNMFESVAIDIYSHLNRVKVHEFGLIKHPKNDFFGASPDGISELGIMVEIKCPRKRRIDGQVPTQYYYQIQGQLDVCDLKECDYFECEFEQYYNEEEFAENYNDMNFKGIIVETEDNKFSYSDGVGAGQDDTLDNLLAWSNSFDTFVSKTYWSLGKYNNVRVIRDDDFLKVNMQLLKEMWDKVRAYRKDRELYVKEVLKEIKIVTQPYKQKEKVTTGWAFIDVAEESVQAPTKPPPKAKPKIGSGWAFIDVEE